MANFAVINNNVVENIIIAESLQIAEEVTNKICVEYSDGTLVGPGYTFNMENGTFIAPPPVERVIPEITE